MYTLQCAGPLCSEVRQVFFLVHCYSYARLSTAVLQFQQQRTVKCQYIDYCIAADVPAAAVSSLPSQVLITVGEP
jgi:hypothetical protein